MKKMFKNKLKSYWRNFYIGFAFGGGIAMILMIGNVISMSLKSLLIPAFILGLISVLFAISSEK